MFLFLTSRDGEDYAVLMSADLCVGELHPRSYCQGTVDTGNSGRVSATSAKQPRAHLWNRVFEKHPDLTIEKTQGHATWEDVEAKRVTAYDKEGNDEADKFSKMGR